MVHLSAVNTSRLVLRFIFFTLLFSGVFFSTRVFSEDLNNVDTLLGQASEYLNTNPEKSVATLSKLQSLQSSFSKKQEEKFYRISAASLGFRGKHRERIELVQSYINKVTEPEIRVKFLYQLSDGFSNLGEYENALLAMNQSIVLLPKIVELNTKISTLQAAVTFFNTLHAYDEAMAYAERMAMLDDKVTISHATCYALANRIEINFLRGKSEQARPLLLDAINTCNASNRKVISLIVKAMAAIDLIDVGNFEQGLIAGLPLLLEFSKTNQTSDYVTQLEEAIARAYVRKGNMALAEHYALQAYQRAKSQNVVSLLEKTSETMAAIKRAQGQLNNALEYYDINLALKKKALDVQLQKNLAYQRVKFDTQDKANQLALSEQKNKILTVEKALQQGKNQNLLLWLTLGLIVLVILGGWLLRTLQQKNIFRTSSQMDGLTQISNRTHFMHCTAEIFKHPDALASVVLFDMDHFKKINDTFGHAVGDWVLRTVSATVKLQLRKTDLLGRLGGEEFAICLPDFTEDEVLALAERCRAAIAMIDTQACGHRFPISASFGVATRDKSALRSFEETLAAADKALYFSKNEGRDRVSAHQ